VIKLIVGLGNPGRKYESTRHNLGFRAVDVLLAAFPAQSERLLHRSLLFDTTDFGMVCKPLTYMNASGNAVHRLSQDFGLQPQEILVLYDDFALELGLIRVRQRGSSGGHKGVQSIIDQLGSTDFPRVRMGIQVGGIDDSVEFVLSEFRASERSAVQEMLDLCKEAVAVILKDGIATAMNRFNKKQKLVNGKEVST
jgi:peptidyl-tRNA hydrolase, PTH1 family